MLAEPKVSPAPMSKGQPKVVLASRAGRLLRSVRLLMAREKSYDVSQGRGSGRGSAPAARWVSCTEERGSLACTAGNEPSRSFHFADLRFQLYGLASPGRHNVLLKCKLLGWGVLIS